MNNLQPALKHVIPPDKLKLPSQFKACTSLLPELEEEKDSNSPVTPNTDPEMRDAEAERVVSGEKEREVMEQ